MSIVHTNLTKLLAANTRVQNVADDYLDFPGASLVQLQS